MLFAFFLLTLAGCALLPTTQQTAPFSVQQIPQARLTYVAIGASETFGTGADSPKTQNWPTDLGTQIGPGTRVVNLGIPGILIHQALNVEMPVAVDSQPNLVTIWLGVNDIANKVSVQSYTHDLDLLLSKLQATNPRCQIAVANMPDVTLLPYFNSYDQDQLRSRVQAYNEVISTEVQKHHVMLVDIYHSWNEVKEHPEYLSGDGLHPSTAGHERLAQIFYQATHQSLYITR